MRKYRRILSAALWLTLVALAMGCSATATVTAEPAATLPQTTAVLAPDFALKTPDGEDVRLSDYRGEVVLVNFWASWCPPCNTEISTLEAYYQAHKDEGLVIIGVNVKESESTVGDFVENNGLSFPVVLDKNADVAVQYGVTGMPTSFFVARDGTLLGYWPGPVTKTMLEEGLTPSLKR
jgi:peroxiredoxin